MSKMTVCKTCGKEVSKSAKFCPHCGAKLKSKKLIFIASGVIILIIIIGIASIGANSSTPSGSLKNSGQDNYESKSNFSEVKKATTNTENIKKEKVNKATTSTVNIKKEIDLLNYIGKSEEDIKKAFGNPNKTDNTEVGEIYDYSDYYFAIADNKVIVIGVNNTAKDVSVNGIKIGMLPKEIKSNNGNPSKEINTDGFQMDYRLNNNSISILYQSSDFASPVDLAIITDLTYGKEMPMEITKDRINQLMNGTWILEKNIHEENLSLYKHIFSDGIIDTNLSEHLQKKYEVTSSNTIIIRCETLNGFGSTENLEAEFFIEFFNSGDKMVIYHLDQSGDKDSEEIYIRYN
jgi:RNA polymerase subunit RPABC4/transcription elongation factor Spt4